MVATPPSRLQPNRFIGIHTHRRTVWPTEPCIRRYRTSPMGFRISDEVQHAVQSGLPVVALESTIISHGMPYPQNVEMAHEVEAIVRKHGATPATIAVIDGVCTVGVDATGIELLASRGDVLKASTRDLPWLVANKGARCHDGCGHHASRIARGYPCLCDRRDRRRAPRCRDQLRHLCRPLRARFHTSCSGVCGGEVDPRHRADTGVSRDAQASRSW